MATIDREVVRHVARLARLRIRPEEEERLVRDMERIVDYVDVLAGLPAPDDADEPDPAWRAPRADLAVSPRHADWLLEQAPEREGDHLRVPPVFVEP